MSASGGRRPGSGRETAASWAPGGWTRRPGAGTEPLGWKAGVAVGALAGIGAAYLNRRLQESSRAGLVDWHRAERIAADRLRRAPGTLPAAELASIAPSYDEAMRRIVPALEEALGTHLPGVVGRHAVVDRATWANANIATFRQLYGRIEGVLGDRLHPAGAGIPEGIASLANRFVATQQVGFMLGYLGTRVLGQYDIALLSAEAAPGQLLFVEENIRTTASLLGARTEEFRLWVALHETTHAFEFEAHPWLRPYLADRLERQMAGLVDDARLLNAEGLAHVFRAWRRRGGQTGLLEALLEPEQRRLFRETQVVMSLLEGFSDWVMDRVGARFLPDVVGLRRRFEERRGAPRKGVDRLVSRLTGMDLKLDQYRRGERFVAGVDAAGGPAAVAHLWDGPHTLPTESELGDPASWVRRVMGVAPGPDPAGAEA